MTGVQTCALPICAEDAQGPSEIAFDEGGHVRSKIGFHVLNILGEGAEDHAAEGLHLERRQAVAADVEVLGHAALAAQAVAEGDTFQTPIQPIIPGVIDAGEAGDVVLLFQADQSWQLRRVLFPCTTIR